MERQKDRRTWSGKKTEKDIERKKDREGHGVAKRQRRTRSSRKTENRSGEAES